MKILIVIPTYTQLDISRQCILTAQLTLPETAEVLVVDDCSPDWSDQFFLGLPFQDRLHVQRRLTPTRSMTSAWNDGMAFARKGRFDCVVLANSDLIFSHGWWEATQRALEKIPDRMTGPMTNAPGSRPEQDIRRLLPDYVANDSLFAVTDTQRKIEQLPTRNRIEDGAVNGFCITAMTDAWFAGAYSSKYVFNPKYPLAGNEDEWQKRVEKQGRQSGRVMGSFVFHYRGLSRGLVGSTRGYYRKDNDEKVEDSPRSR